MQYYRLILRFIPFWTYPTVSAESVAGYAVVEPGIIGHIFKPLTNLSHLFLMGNGIMNLASSIFSRNSKLELLNLSDNKLP